LPIDIWISSLYFVRKTVGGFAHNFEGTFDRQSKHQVLCEVYERFARQGGLDGVDGGENMHQPVG